MTLHQYIGIEILTMTAAMKQTLVQHLRSLGPLQSDQPCMLNHWRLRLDGDAAIFEADFEDVTIRPAAIVAKLAQWYSVAPGTVTYTQTQTVHGPVMTIKTGSTNRLRLIAFGGIDASLGESLVAVTKYLAANMADWEPLDL